MRQMASDLLGGDAEKETPMATQVTMLDLVTVVAENAKSEAEVVATVVHMVNTGLVRLDGKLRGAHFDLRALPPGRFAAA